jgi:hypothetical protein
MALTAPFAIVATRLPEFEDDFRAVDGERVCCDRDELFGDRRFAPELPVRRRADEPEDRFAAVRELLRFAAVRELLRFVVEPAELLRDFVGVVATDPSMDWGLASGYPGFAAR